jgi:hypothetical protein
MRRRKELPTIESFTAVANWQTEGNSPMTTNLQHQVTFPDELRDELEARCGISTLRREGTSSIEMAIDYLIMMDAEHCADFGIKDPDRRARAELYVLTTVAPLVEAAVAQVLDFKSWADFKTAYDAAVAKLAAYDAAIARAKQCEAQS